MDVIEFIKPGLRKEQEMLVEEKHTAGHVGSGALRVLATPAMIGFMERNAHQMLAENLPAGYSSVGVVVEVRHLAPTPVGQKVRVVAEVLEVEGVKVNLAIEAWDPTEKIGEGRHQRVVIDEARFLRRVEAKIAEKGG
jgi:fluoroacetyl-CoA thioesterase